MAFLTFNKANNPSAPDELRINPDAVLYVEASRPDLMGATMIHLLGEGTTVNSVSDSLGTVVSAIQGLVAATRHYLAGPPETGASTVYISPRHISFVRPNLPAAADFWVIRYTDGSELRVLDPLPSQL
jgi:hypothetical protein